MKCLCFSDSHGRLSGIRRALEIHPDAEVVFFLGDGLSDMEAFIGEKNRAYLAVRGNCDSSAIFGGGFVKSLDSINILGHRIVFTHGHLYSVKYGLDGVKRLAADIGADIVLFGHTHEPLEKYIPAEKGGFYLFNPGSVGGFKPSYGIINITDQGILLSHGSL